MNETLIKQKLIRSECLSPPHEIRENKNLRQAWLDSRVAEINRRPDRRAKIVGKGSYQSVSVYEVTRLMGRVRFRGSCQFCGHSQVVDASRIVLHGYKRPGWGSIVGDCPGHHKAPLNTSKDFTEQQLALWIKAHEERKAHLVAAENARQAAMSDKYADPIAEKNEERAYLEKPAAIKSRTPTESEIVAHKLAYESWSKKFPLTATLVKAEKVLRMAQQDERDARSMKDHFQHLIDSKIYGTPLTKEVVT